MPPLISDRMARNGLSIRPVRTSRPTWAVDLQSNDQSRPFATPSGRHPPPEAPFRKNPSQPPSKTPSREPFEDNLSKILRKTPSHPPEDPFAPSFEDSFATLFEDPLEDLSESPFDSHLEAPPPFRIPSEHAACPESFRSRREALPSAPFEDFAGTFFGVFRRRPRAPSANDASPSGSPRVYREVPE